MEEWILTCIITTLTSVLSVLTCITIVTMKLTLKWTCLGAVCAAMAKLMSEGIHKEAFWVQECSQKISDLLGSHTDGCEIVCVCRRGRCF